MRVSAVVQSRAAIRVVSVDGAQLAAGGTVGLDTWCKKKEVRPSNITECDRGHVSRRRVTAETYSSFNLIR